MVVVRAPGTVYVDSEDDRRVLNVFAVIADEPTFRNISIGCDDVNLAEVLVERGLFKSVYDVVRCAYYVAAVLKYKYGEVDI